MEAFESKAELKFDGFSFFFVAVRSDNHFGFRYLRSVFSPGVLSLAS